MRLEITCKLFLWCRALSALKRILVPMRIIFAAQTCGHQLFPQTRPYSSSPERKVLSQPPDMKSILGIHSVKGSISFPDFPDAPDPSFCSNHAHLLVLAAVTVDISRLLLTTVNTALWRCLKHQQQRFLNYDSFMTPEGRAWGLELS